MKDKRKGLDRVGESSVEIDRETPCRESRSKRSLVMPSAVYKHAQKFRSFAGISEVAKDTAELGNRDLLITLSEVHRNVQQSFNFAGSAGQHMTQLSLKSLISQQCAPSSAVPFVSSVQTQSALTCSSQSGRPEEPLSVNLVGDVDIMLFSVGPFPKPFM